MYQAPRGTLDRLPEDQAYWNYVEKTAADVAALYGYSRLDTPVFEDSGLFIRSVGEGTDIVEKEMYTFNDLGGNSVTLRPEGTAPVCRAYVEHGMQNLTQPVKLYYLMSIYRYERPQAGRLREFHQFGFEAIGESSALLDAEVIDMSCRFYRELGLKDLKLLVNSIGCQDCRKEYLKTLREYYKVHVDELCDDCKKRLEKNTLRVLDCKKPGCKPLADNAPKSTDHLCDDCKAHFEQLTARLDQLGLDYKIDHRLVRGLDYYTRTVYEVQPLIEGGQSTIGGGGRYDGLIEELGGKPTQAVGFATGLERVILNLKRAGINPPEDTRKKVFVIWFGDEALRKAGHIMDVLHENGISAITSYSGRSMKAQMRQANSNGANYVIIIGDTEVAENKYTFKDMENSSQETVTEEELLEKLR
jgi:histidyl-tRNA synthetase